MAVGTQLLQAARIQGVYDALQDPREAPQPLLMLDRTPVVPATDMEIIARFIGRISIADIIPDDQGAVTYSMGKLNLETTNIPNIKLGYNLTQGEINQLRSLQRLGGVAGGNDGGYFSNREPMILEGLRTGIRERWEHLLWGCAADSFVYDRLGVKLNLTWGMPADLKTTLTGGATWDQAATATPLTDILNRVLLGQTRYGITYDRLTMSRQAFNYMTQTTDFINRARAIYAPWAPNAPVPYQQMDLMRNLVQQIAGVMVEIYDARYWQTNLDGTQTSARYMPVNQVVFSSTSNDNNAAAINLANTEVTESLVADAIGEPLGSLGPRYGPVVYATAPEDLNPPNVTYWGVARSMPRKFRLQATSVITVGTFSDTIATGEPF